MTYLFSAVKSFFLFLLTDILLAISLLLLCQSTALASEKSSFVLPDGYHQVKLVVLDQDGKYPVTMVLESKNGIISRSVIDYPLYECRAVVLQEDHPETGKILITETMIDGKDTCLPSAYLISMAKKTDDSHDSVIKKIITVTDGKEVETEIISGTSHLSKSPKIQNVHFSGARSAAIFKKSLDYKEMARVTPLCKNTVEAAFYGKYDELKELIDTGVDINTCHYYGKTPLIAAVLYARQYQTDKNLAVVKYLVNKGADIHIGWSTKKGNYSPVRLAMAKGHLKTGKYLLTQGADVTEARKGYQEYSDNAAASNAMLFSAIGLAGKAAESIKKYISSGSSGTAYSNYSSDANTAERRKDTNAGPQSGYVTSIRRDGSKTTVKCSIGNDTKIYRDNYGKCSDNYSLGSYSCDFVLNEARKRCENRRE